VHGHGIRPATELRSSALEVEQALRQWSQRGVKIFGAWRVAWVYGRDERAAANGRNRDTRVDKFLVGEGDGVAVDAEVFCQIANRGLWR